jgi:porin
MPGLFRRAAPLGLGVSLLATHLACAQSPAAPAPVSLDSVTQQPLWADWGPRADLAARGVSFVGHYYGEAAANDKGYSGSGWAIAQQLDLFATIDLAKLGAPLPGIVRIGVSQRVGRDLSHDKTGAYFQNQAFVGQGQDFRLDEISYERFFLGKAVSLKGGFYSMGNDFAGLPSTCNYTSNAMCGHPLSLLYGSGWVDSPTGQWGGRIKLTARSGLYAETGAYEVNPHRKQKDNGNDLGTDTATGVIIPFEAGYVRGKTPADYAGTYKVGLYYDDSHVADVAIPSKKRQGRGGGYVQATQQVWKPEPNTARGVSVFGVATLNDADTGLFRTYYEAGASWRGPLAVRPDDIISLGWAQANINPRLRRVQQEAGKPAQTDEQIAELNYTVQATPWLVVRPGVQYVVRPSGYETRPDTAVVTLHLQATF